jgi:hypothetical protein
VPASRPIDVDAPAMHRTAVTQIRFHGLGMPAGRAIGAPVQPRKTGLVYTWNLVDVSKYGTPTIAPFWTVTSGKRR